MGIFQVFLALLIFVLGGCRHAQADAAEATTSGVESLVKPLQAVCSTKWDQWTRSKIHAVWPEPLQEHECVNASDLPEGCTDLSYQGVLRRGACSRCTFFDFKIIPASNQEPPHERLHAVTIFLSSKNVTDVWKHALALVDLIDSSLAERMCDTGQWHLDDKAEPNIFRCDRDDRIDERTAYVIGVEVMIYRSDDGWTLRLRHWRDVMEFPQAPDSGGCE